eukprot:symbB.v1.2.012791.t1/scaffold884.1/size313170/3
MDISDAYDLLCTVQAVKADVPEIAAYHVFDSPPGLELPWAAQMPMDAPISRVTMPPPVPGPALSSAPPGLCDAQNFSEAKRGFEEAISMFLASYPREVAQPHAPMPPCIDDDEQTDCEASVPGTPRGRGLFSTKFGLPVDSLHPDHDDGVATPRTNKTLFVHGRFSA